MTQPPVAPPERQPGAPSMRSGSRDEAPFLRAQGEPSYLEEVTEGSDDEDGASGIAGVGEGKKGLFDQAVDVVSREGKASTSFVQRHLPIGCNRAARQMEREGIVSLANHVVKREVLVRRHEDWAGGPARQEALGLLVPEALECGRSSEKG